MLAHEFGRHVADIEVDEIQPVALDFRIVGARHDVTRGEFGAIVFIAGNLPGETEIAALLAFIRLEEFDYNGAAAIALVLLGFALVLLVVSNILQSWAARHREATR